MAEKIILGVCSTGSRLKLAVFDGKKFYCAQRSVVNQEKPLFPMIAGLLKSTGQAAPLETGLRAVKIYCAVRGPGRFTGIRIGLTLGKVLEALAGIKVYSATLFEIMALQAFESPDCKSWARRRQKPKIAALMRAFKDEYFCQVFNAGTGLKRPVPALEPQWLKILEMKAYLSALGPELFVIGDAEEDTSVYALAPAYCEKAAPVISKMIPAYLIKTAMALKNRNLVPLYLKPARYELDQKTSLSIPAYKHTSLQASDLC